MSEVQEKRSGYGRALGLNLDLVNELAPEERAEFTRTNLAGRGGKFMYPLSAYSFMMENRPDVLKHHYRLTGCLGTGEEGLGPTVVLALLHHYTVLRFEEGIIHEVRSAQAMGATKAQINEMLALTFIHGGCCGWRGVYEQTMEYMTQYQEPAKPIVWPAGWAPDVGAFASGMDFSARDMLPGERDKLFGWYESTIGFVPRSVALMVKLNSAFAKAYRGKFENAMSTGALPKQIVPYVFIYYNVHRGFRDGIREAVLLGKAWGMTRDQVVNAIVLGVAFMGGMDSAYIVDDAVGDLLDSWEG